MPNVHSITIGIHYLNSDRSGPIAPRTRKHTCCDRLEVDISQINDESTFWAHVCTYPPLFSAHRGQSNPTNRSFRQLLRNDHVLVRDSLK
jgi:hypothetical protein